MPCPPRPAAKANAATADPANAVSNARSVRKIRIQTRHAAIPHPVGVTAIGAAVFPHRVQPREILGGAEVLGRGLQAASASKPAKADRLTCGLAKGEEA